MTTEDDIHLIFNRLRGRMLGFIEALTLSDVHETQLKRHLKSLSYDSERDIQKAVESGTGENHGTDHHPDQH